MKTTMQYRQQHIDAVAGLLIINMILGHCIQTTDCTDIILYKWMNALSFFMSWFFFKSGMYYTKKSIKSQIKSFKKLLIPFTIFSAIGHVMTCVKLFMDGDFNWVHYVVTPIIQILLMGCVGGNMPLWFLLSLCMVQLIYQLICTKLKDEWLFIIGVTLSFTFNILAIHTPVYLANISLGLAFYALGHKLCKVQYTNTIFYLSILIYASVLFLYPSVIDFRSNQTLCGSYLLAILFSLAGCTLYNALFKRTIKSNIINSSFHDNMNRYLNIRDLFKCIISQPFCKILIFVGENAMTFYVFHWLIIRSCNLVLSLCKIEGNITQLLIIIIINCLSLPLLSILFRDPKYSWMIDGNLKKLTRHT